MPDEPAATLSAKRQKKAVFQTLKYLDASLALDPQVPPKHATRKLTCFRYDTGSSVRRHRRGYRRRGARPFGDRDCETACRRSAVICKHDGGANVTHLWLPKQPPGFVLGGFGLGESPAERNAALAAAVVGFVSRLEGWLTWISVVAPLCGEASPDHRDRLARSALFFLF